MPRLVAMAHACSSSVSQPRTLWQLGEGGSILFAHTSTGAAEANEIVVVGGKAARLCCVPYGPAHALVGDLEKSVRNLLRRKRHGRLGVYLGRQLGELFCHNVGIERLVRLLSKDGRERGYNQAAEEQVCIRNGERAAFPVTRRAGVGSRTLSSQRNQKQEDSRYQRK